MPTSLDYQRLVIAYHGCDVATARAVLLGEDELRPSVQAWDWLGNGIYFWEHGPERALEWARRRVATPAVLGAYVNLGICFDLLDVHHTRALTQAHAQLSAALAARGKELPQNRAGFDGDADLVRRELDCSVVNWWKDECAKSGAATYQTVRGAFTEGGAVYPGGLIFEKTHIQIAIRDPDCILGYFRPR